MKSDEGNSMRMVFRTIEHFVVPDGQFLTQPEFLVDAYWTSLDWMPEQNQRIYEIRETRHQRAVPQRAED